MLSFLLNFMIFSLLNDITICHKERVKCVGTGIDELADDCEIIVGRPLIIKQFKTNEIDNKGFDRKLETIREIRSGLEITSNQFIEFNSLVNVISITNPNGPAILFEGNSILEKFDFPKLRELSGKNRAVVFRNDKFPSFAYNNTDSLRKLFSLEAAARKNGTKCSDHFLHVEFSPEAPTEDWEYLSLSFGALLIFLSLDAFLIHKIWLKKSKRPREKNQRGRKQNKKDKRKKPIQP